MNFFHLTKVLPSRLTVEVTHEEGTRRVKLANLHPDLTYGREDLLALAALFTAAATMLYKEDQ